MADITIPDEVRPALMRLASTEPQALRKLLAILAQQQPRQSNRKFVKAVMAAMGPTEGLDVVATVEALMSMAAGRYALGLPVEEFAQSVAQSEDIDLPEDARVRLSDILRQALPNDALTVTAKAWDLLTENAANFKQARIVTDIRPIFSDADEPPPAAVIVHMLRLTYWGATDEQAFWLGMDDNDMEELRKVVVRAQTKSQQLRSGGTEATKILPQEQL